METSVEYISGGINPTRSCAAWSRRWLAVGVDSAVVLNDVERGVLNGRHLLRGHKNRINCLEWIDEVTLVTGSTDTRGCVWRIEGNDDLSYQCTFLEGHSSPINAVTGHLSKDDLIVGTSGGDDTITIWTGQLPNIIASQTIRVPHNALCISLKFCHFRGNSPFLMAGTSSCEIILYSKDNNQSTFSVITVLGGHRDWVLSIDSVSISASEILVASGAQDNTIRIWKIESRVNYSGKDDGNIKSNEHGFHYRHRNDVLFTANLETVLTGHEDSVTGVRWSSDTMNPKLLTASIDNSLILWETSHTGLWVENVRTGEVGGSNLGLLGCCISHNNKTLLTYGFRGGIYAWFLTEDSCWQPITALTGHTSAVSDVAWQSDFGLYIISTGREDQTCRLHFPCSIKSESGCTRQWHEVARSQIHGYDLTCVVSLSPFSYASGSEEKIIRIFNSSYSFKSNYDRALANSDINSGGRTQECYGNEYVIDSKSKDIEIVRAPALGLSNKVSCGMIGPNKTEPLHTEDILGNETLWPETRKLYGLGREVFTMDVSKNGKIIAAASIANSDEQAGIMIWKQEEKKWSAPSILKGHSLTVTELRFSPLENDTLLSVSRDRKWRLWCSKKNTDKGDSSTDFELRSVCPKSTGHSRIIWACAWSSDGKVFFTASRDKKIMAWDSHSNLVTRIKEPYITQESVTALDCAPFETEDSNNLLCAGLENGRLELINWTKELGFVLLMILPMNQSHSNRVNRIRFRPTRGECSFENRKKVMQFVSVGDDHLVLVHNIVNDCKDSN